METADPSHQYPFYARHVGRGAVFRLLGYLGVVLVIIQEGRGPSWALPVLTAVLLLTWTTAWCMQVGALWRSSLVAALLAAFLFHTLRWFVAS